jgi:hypothetical protein
MAPVEPSPKSPRSPGKPADVVETQHVKMVVEAAPRYLIGFPLVVALTYEDHSLETGAQGLPESVVWGVVDDRIGIHLVPIRGGAPVDVKAQRWDPEPLEAQVSGLSLNLRETRRMLFDLTNLGLAFQPGVYHLSLRISFQRRQVESAPVTVELVAPSAADAAEATRLRSLGLNPPRDNPLQWVHLLNYWGTVIPSPALSVEARQQVAWHLFLHRAFYGQEDVAHLDASALDAVVSPALRAEVLAEKLEIALARRDPGAARLESELLTRYPGMRRDVDDIHASQGFLATFRKELGAESSYVKPGAPRLYPK